MLNVKFLEKQIVLMSNLITKYWSKAKTQSWLNLKTILSEKNNFLLDIIGTDDNRTSLLVNLRNMLDNNLEAH